MQKFLDFVCKYKYSLLCFVYLFVISFCLENYALQPIQAVTIVLSISSIFIILGLLSKVKYTLWVTVLIGIFIAFDSCFAFFFKSSVTIGIVASIFETNAGEASEFLGTVFLKGILALLVALFLVVMTQRELKAVNFLKKKYIIFLLWFFLIHMPSFLYLQIKDDYKEVILLKESPLMRIQEQTAYSMPVVYNDIMTVAAYLNEKKKFRSYLNSERVLPDNISFNKSDSSYQKIFLVIGESSSQKHYSLYGYDVKTTPFLDSLYQSQAVNFNYYNAISGATITRDALKLSLSFATPSSDALFYKGKNIIDLANDAGYETVWISNQDMVGKFEGYVGFIASCATKKCFAEAYTNAFTRDDLDLVKLVKENYSSNKKQLFVIHLMGSHQRYFERSDEVDKQAIPDNGSVYAEYDRSIHHTDRVFRNLFPIFQKDSSSFLMYFSDHGEKVNEGHGFVGLGPDQFEIPLMYMSNNTYPVKSLIEKYTDKASGVISNTTAPYIMAEIFGYSVSPKLVEQAIVDGRSVLESNHKVRLFQDIKSEGK